MSTLSVCLIVKNEEDCIEKCIKSLQPFADEICIYDTGSTDKTIDICRNLDGVTIVEGEWRMDFAWARNQSFNMAKSDYIMWVDADDIVDERSQKFLNEFKKEEINKYDHVYMMYRYNVTPENTDSLHFYRMRIVRRILYPIWNGRIHETVTTTAKTNPISYYIPIEDAYVCHYKHKDSRGRNLAIFRDMEDKNEIYRGRDWFYFGNELRENGFVEEAVQKYIKCTNSADSWKIDKLNSYIHLSTISLNKGKASDALKYAYLAASCTNKPRADACCIIGDIYQKMRQWEWAAMWYRAAYGNVTEKLEATFLDEDCSTWKPLLNLCVCEYNLGNVEKAEEYNNKVLEIVPNNIDAINNKKTFDLLKENKSET